MDRRIIVWTVAILSISAVMVSAFCTDSEARDIGDSGLDIDEENAIRVSTPEELVSISEISNGLNGYDAFDFSGYTILMIQDIDMRGIEWTPIGMGSYSFDIDDITADSKCFKGTIDGLDHTISNLKISIDGGRTTGFIGFLYGGFLLNIQFKDADVGGTNDIGVAVGVCKNGSISNVVVNGGSVHSESDDAVFCIGSLVGWAFCNDGTSYIDGCYSSADVNVVSKSMAIHVGGMCGAYEGRMAGHIEISGNAHTGNITVDSPQSLNVGGVAGSLYATGNDLLISDSYSVSDIVVNGGVKGLGGLFGFLNINNGGLMTISQCYVSGNITASGPEDMGSCIGTGNGSASIEALLFDTGLGNVAVGTEDIEGCVGIGGPDMENEVIMAAYLTDSCWSFVNGAMPGLEKIGEDWETTYPEYSTGTDYRFLVVGLVALGFLAVFGHMAYNKKD